MTINDLVKLMDLIETMSERGNIHVSDMEDWGSIYNAADNLVTEAASNVQQEQLKKAYDANADDAVEKRTEYLDEITKMADCARPYPVGQGVNVFAELATDEEVKV
jgi:hypothetical protein